MKFILTVAACAGVALALSTPAQATIVGVTGAGLKIAAPANVLDDGTTTPTDQMWGFDEMQGVLLAAALDTDQGFIGPDIVVNSHMIFLNTQGSTNGAADAVWEFDGNILGVMSDSHGNREAASTSFLAAIGTTYPASGFNNRGIETNNDTYGIAGNILRISLHVTEPGDWVRVVTASAVPEPGSLLLLGSGLLGLGAAIRRRRSK